MIPPPFPQKCVTVRTSFVHDLTGSSYSNQQNSWRGGSGSTSWCGESGLCQLVW